MRQKTIFFLIAILILALPNISFAYQTDFGNVQNLGQYITEVLRQIMPIVAGLALLMIIYAGYKYMTSQGNPEGITEAKDIMLGVIFGVILLFLIQVLLSNIIGTTP